MSGEVVQGGGGGSGPVLDQRYRKQEGKEQIRRQQLDQAQHQIDSGEDGGGDGDFPPGHGPEDQQPACQQHQHEQSAIEEGRAQGVSGEYRGSVWSRRLHNDEESAQVNREVKADGAGNGAEHRDPPQGLRPNGHRAFLLHMGDRRNSPFFQYSRKTPSRQAAGMAFNSGYRCFGQTAPPLSAPWRDRW